MPYGGNSWFKQTKFKAIDIADTTAKGPAAILDFRKGQQALTTVASGSIAGATTAQLISIASDTYANSLTFTRASTTTYIDVNGVMQTAAVDAPRFDYTNGVRQQLVEGASTNLFLNSATGVTQNITSTAQSYTLSFYGTGSIAISGSATGTLNGTGANNRVSLTVTAIVGLLVLTVTGSTTLVQVEALPFATSYIPTTSSAVTRAGDIPRLGPKLEALIQRAGGGTIVWKGRVEGLTPSGTAMRLVGGALSSAFPGVEASGSISAWNNVTVINTGVVSVTSSFGAGFSWATNYRGVSANSSVVVSSTGLIGPDLSKIWLGSDGASGGGNPMYGWVDQLIIYPFRATDAEVQRLASAYV